MHVTQDANKAWNRVVRFDDKQGETHEYYTSQLQDGSCER